MRTKSVLFLCLFIFSSLVFCSFAQEWKAFDEFDTFIWEVQEWPMTENSQITWDKSRSISGGTSLKTTIECKGWGGGIKIANPPILQPPKKQMSVNIFCKANPGATGIPAAKLEVYPMGNGEVMGSDDTPIQPGKWTTVVLPASRMEHSAKGCGIIFLKGTGEGKFTIWVDALMKDGDIWEDFEYHKKTLTWVPVNVNGAFQFNLVGPGYNGMPPLEKGTAVRLAWHEDSDGAEIKAYASEPLDISSWNKVKIRCALSKGSPPMNVSLWLFDGEKGSLAVSEPVKSITEWSDAIHDLGIHKEKVNMKHINEIGIVMHDYTGNAGAVYIDKIEYK